MSGASSRERCTFYICKKEVVDISHTNKSGSQKISYRAMMGSQKLDAFFNAINANAPAPEKKEKEE